MTRPKTIWIVEDSESDVMLYKLKLEVGDCHVKYYKSLHGLGWKLMLQQPDAVIVDYHLAGITTGDSLYETCQSLGIPALMVTGNEGEMFDIPPEDVVIKEHDHSQYQKISNWINRHVIA